MKKFCLAVCIILNFFVVNAALAVDANVDVFGAFDSGEDGYRLYTRGFDAVPEYFSQESNLRQIFQKRTVDNELGLKIICQTKMIADISPDLLPAVKDSAKPLIVKLNQIGKFSYIDSKLTKDNVIGALKSKGYGEKEILNVIQTLTFDMYTVKSEKYGYEYGIGAYRNKPVFIIVLFENTQDGPFDYFITKLKNNGINHESTGNKKITYGYITHKNKKEMVFYVHERKSRRLLVQLCNNQELANAVEHIEKLKKEYFSK